MAKVVAKTVFRAVMGLIAVVGASYGPRLTGWIAAGASLGWAMLFGFRLSAAMFASVIGSPPR